MVSSLSTRGWRRVWSRPHFFRLPWHLLFNDLRVTSVVSLKFWHPPGSVSSVECANVQNGGPRDGPGVLLITSFQEGTKVVLLPFNLLIFIRSLKTKSIILDPNGLRLDDPKILTDWLDPLLPMSWDRKVEPFPLWIEIGLDLKTWNVLLKSTYYLFITENICLLLTPLNDSHLDETFFTTFFKKCLFPLIYRVFLYIYLSFFYATYSLFISILFVKMERLRSN